MVSKNDWRRMGQGKYLFGIEFQYVKSYVPCAESWEHEHCNFCMAKVSAYDGDLLLFDGLKKQWVCCNCFDDFKDEFKWRVQKK